MTAMVVVKRCTNANADGAQARAEFLSDLSLIAGLPHHNPLSGVRRAPATFASSLAARQLIEYRLAGRAAVSSAG
jgi:hypothetical protein